MSEERPPARQPEFGDGILFRISTRIYWVMAITLCFTVANVLLIGASMFLIRDASNIVLAAVAAIPTGPALTAMIFSFRQLKDGPGSQPVKEFIRGYRLNAVDTLRFWVPAMAVVWILSFNLSYLLQSTKPMDTAVMILTFILSGVLVLWLAAMLQITAAYSFRLRDAARLAMSYLILKPGVAIGNAALVIIILGIFYNTSDWIVGLLAGLLGYLFTINGKPMLEAIYERHVQRPDEDVARVN